MMTLYRELQQRLPVLNELMPLVYDTHKMEFELQRVDPVFYETYFTYYGVGGEQMASAQFSRALLNSHLVQKIDTRESVNVNGNLSENAVWRKVR